MMLLTIARKAGPPKPVRERRKTRRPNELGTGRLVVTAVDPGEFKPIKPREVAACYGNQLACILWDTANINTTKIRKNENLKKLLLTRLHARPVPRSE